MGRPWVVERRKVLKRGSLAKGTEPTYRYELAPELGSFAKRRDAQLSVARRLDPELAKVSDEHALVCFRAWMSNARTYRFVREPDPQLSLALG